MRELPWGEWVLPGVDAAGEAVVLSTGAAARRLGVAVATLRSWDRRYGLGAGHVSSGGHRRYTSADMARLAYMCALVADGVPSAEAADAARAFTVDAAACSPAADTYGTLPAPESTRLPVQSVPSAPGEGKASRLSDAGRTVRGLTRAAMRLDADAVLSVLEREFGDRGVVGAWEALARPTLYGMGRKWERNARTDTASHYVEVEHLLSECVSTALRRTRPGPHSVPWPPRGGRGVLLACAEKELHTLPLEALTASLAERRVPVRMFGAALPGEALLRAVRRTGPAAVVLWSHTDKTAEPQLLGKLLRQAALLVCAAGPGWRNASTPNGSYRLTSLPQAVAVLAPESPRTKPARVPEGG
ncbi:MAG TPA: MerR family transcriptional regulator [Yinghuangia sp.]|nr:MerR family transcriptional regulator [Yinghuangia sp.]